MLIKVTAYPGSKKAEVIKLADDNFDVFVKSSASGGEANREIVRLLTAYFNVSAANTRLVKGGKERKKIFEIC